MELSGKRMKIAIGSDHGGFLLKQAVKDHLKEKKIEFVDVGCDVPMSCDYPIYAKKVTDMIKNGEADLGILVCGTGIGMSMAANKEKGIRAALCHDSYSAKVTREHNDANVLCMGARVIGPGYALTVVDAFLESSFSGDERHARRLSMFE